ncbi:thiamine pyrophosphate-binding protein [Aeromicrobium sp. YIM 150415]|uniref:thiamine pyrophosphate-binding protein n=1 Tax=Aeromicrobium sp. YIM 150415 TaxID=2803912 RepID=UPI001963025B|nr:thiamine pyrophosphate-binding protein [Aeromicrobium sp. YIM 150415]MBM9463233.1 thiamine pyrophosphate-binding protein [Aeromicrobium sp. YIM 150415]
METVHEAAAAAIADQHGPLFGLIGDANMRIVDRYVNEHGGRFLGAVHEAGAVGMADGWSRISGRVGFASLTHGPGLTNALTALTEAVRARRSLVLLTGSTPAGVDHFQRFDIEGLARLAGAAFLRLEPQRSARHLVAEAAALAQVGRSPVVVDIPVDLLDQSSGDEDPADSTMFTTSAPAPDADQLDRVLGILATARRPVVLAGRGAVQSGAGPAIARLADLMSAPLATTLLAKGLFAGHPADLGVMGTLGSDVATEVISRADCIIAFGAGLNRFTTADGGLVDGATVIRCDDDPARLGGTSGEVPVLADADRAARLLHDTLAAHEIEFSGYRDERMLARIAAYDPRATFADRGGDGRVDLRSAMLELDDLLPADRLVVSDTGRFIYPTWKYLEVGRAGHFVHTLNFASIGLGLATAIGAAVAEPERLTVAVVGDGGGLMGIQELVTAVRHRVPLVVLVCNDGAYGMEYRYLDDAGLDPSLSLLPGADFTRIAEAMGCDAVRITSLAELGAIPDLVAGMDRRPLIVELMTDPRHDPGR